MSQFNYILASDSITVFFKGKSYTVHRSAETFDMVLNAIQQNSSEALEEALDVRSKVYKQLENVSVKVTISDNEIYYGDRPITGLIASRIFEMLRLSLDVQPMVRFIENLMQNPSFRAVNELFGFLDACSLPITEDGYFLAYKRVSADYMDCFTNTIDNSIGQKPSMERSMVDEDSNRTCSKGLHVCSYDYLQHYQGDRIVVCKIHPKDVVAIPVDYYNSKMRVCEYEVVDEIPVSSYAPTRKIADYYTDEYSSIDDVEDDDEDDEDEEPESNLNDFDDDEDDVNLCSDYLVYNYIISGRCPRSDQLAFVRYAEESTGADNLDKDIRNYMNNVNPHVTLKDIAVWYDCGEDFLQGVIRHNMLRNRAVWLQNEGIATQFHVNNLTSILYDCATDKTNAQIAREWNTSARTIRRIKSGQR